MDDCSRHDSSAIIEMIAMTIEDDPGLEFISFGFFWFGASLILIFGHKHYWHEYMGGKYNSILYQHQVMRRCDEEGKPRPTIAIINESWC